MERIAFVKTGWATDYEGEEVVGRHAHIGEHNEAHERFNFKKAPDGRFYGYIPPMGQFETCPKPANTKGWLLIFVSARNGNGPLTVVGFYENAIFEREYVDRPEYGYGDFATDVHGNPFGYCFSASKATLIPLHLRQTVVSGDHFKRSPIIYVKGTGKDQAWRTEMAELAEAIIANRPVGRDTTPSFKFPDAAHRKAVEEAAVAHTYKIYDGEYDITDFQKEKCGYDLLFTHRKTKEELHVEVKGTSEDLMHFYMTRNEQRYIENPKWRLFMVTTALENPRGTLMDLDSVKAVFDLVPFAWEGVAKIRL